MDIPYAEIFVGLLVAYMAFSVWTRLDGRYPIGAALVLLVATAVVDAAGDVTAANSLAEFVFFLLAGGVVLLLIEHVRGGSAVKVATDSTESSAQRVPPEAPDEGKGSAEQTLDGLQEEPVAVVDRSGRDDQDDKEGGDAEAEGGQFPSEGERRVESPEEEPGRNGGHDDRDDEMPVERMDASADRELSGG